MIHLIAESQIQGIYVSAYKNVWLVIHCIGYRNQRVISIWFQVEWNVSKSKDISCDKSENNHHHFEFSERNSEKN